MGQYMCKRLLWAKKEIKIIVLGLDAAGKTTMLYTLKLGEIVETIPTIGFNVETVNVGNREIIMWDVGGRSKMRALTRYYFQLTDGIVYIIDSNDRERLDEAVDEFHSLLTEDELRDCTFMVLCNKQDLDGSMTVDEIKEKIDKSHKDKIGFFPVSSLKRKTLVEPMEWLSNQLANKETRRLVETSKTEAKDLVKPITVPKHYLKQSWIYLKSFFT